MNSSYKSKFLVVFIVSLVLLSIPIIFIFALLFNPVIANNFASISPVLEPYQTYFSGFLVIAAYICFLWSCHIIAKGKGYSGWYTLAGFLFLNGLLLLIFLPNKTQTTIALPKRRVFVSNILFIIAVFLSILPAVIAFLTIGRSSTGTVNNLEQNDIGQIVGTLITIFFFCSFLIGVLYLLTGIGRLIYEKAKNIKKSNHWEIKSFIFIGVFIIIFTYIIFSMLSLALGFFSIGPDNLQLPNLPPIS